MPRGPETGRTYPPGTVGGLVGVVGMSFACSGGGAGTPSSSGPRAGGARVEPVPGQALEAVENLPGTQVPRGQPPDGAKDLQLRVQPLAGVTLHCCGDFLGDGHERHRQRDLHDRETTLARSSQESPGQRGYMESLGQGQARYPSVVEAFQVGTLALGAAREGDPSRHDHLRAEEPGSRILKLAHVRPGDPPRRA